MTAENLQAQLRRQPFVPFRVFLSGGTHYDVLHPEMMIIAKTGATVAVYDKPDHPEGDIPERLALLSYLHITSTEELNRQRAG